MIEPFTRGTVVAHKSVVDIGDFKQNTTTKHQTCLAGEQFFSDF